MDKRKKSQNSDLPEHRKKKTQKGRKSMRGVPEYYDQPKAQANYVITPKAKEGIEELSRERDISCSELIERIGRRIIQIM